MPGRKGSYRVSFKAATPPGLGIYTVMVGLGPNLIHVLSIYNTGAIVAEGGYLAPYYSCVTNAAVLDGSIVTVTFAWDGANLLDNGHHVKMRVEGGGEGTTLAFESNPWDALPLNELYVGDASGIIPVSAYPEWIGRVQWSGRTDVF